VLHGATLENASMTGNEGTGQVLEGSCRVGYDRSVNIVGTDPMPTCPFSRWNLGTLRSGLTTTRQAVCDTSIPIYAVGVSP
jgi:hypothetical protein